MTNQNQDLGAPDQMLDMASAKAKLFRAAELKLSDPSVPITVEARHVLKEYKHTFVLAPPMWSRISLAENLRWSVVPFDEAHKDCLPDDKIGVYAFVLQPGLSDPPAGAYVLYIGMTSTQNFRDRYKQHLKK